MQDDKKIINSAILFMIVILTTGHIEWMNYSQELNKQIETLETDKCELEIRLENSEAQRSEYEIAIHNQNELINEINEKLANSEGEILNYEYKGEYTITAYCCERYPHICGGGNTASGVAPTPYLTCASCDLNTFPYGTIIYIEDVGIRVVQDTGNFHSQKIDVAVAKHDEAQRWKTTKHKVWIVREK